MKRKLNNPTRYKLKWELLIGDKINSPLDKLGFYLKSVIDNDNDYTIDVSKIWVSSKSYEKLTELIIEYFKNIHKLNSNSAKRETSMYNLMYAPAMDYNSTFNLDDDYIYVEEDYIYV